MSAPACAGVVAPRDGYASPKNRPLVITTCAATKRHRRTVTVDEIAEGGQEDVAQRWLRRLCEELKLHPLYELYGGRAFQTACKAAEAANADLSVVSAGLGYLRGDAMIPAYDLTIRDVGPGSVKRRIVGNFDVHKWWRSVASGRFSSSLKADITGRPFIFMCLSRSYADLIRDELEALAPYHREIRIFGLSISEHLPEGLRNSVMPYDERLSAIDGGGTRTDFAQRALHHYVKSIHSIARESLTQARESVESALSDKKQPTHRKQTRLKDEEVTRLICRLWPEFGHNYGKMLHHIRNELNFSCEQSRFSKLFRQRRTKASA